MTSEDLAVKVREMHAEGFSVRRIATVLDISYSRVWRLVNPERVADIRRSWRQRNREKARAQDRRQAERRRLSKPPKDPLPPRKIGQTLPWEGVTE